jgi:hypothetical protein
MFPKFEGVIGLVAFLVFAYLAVDKYPQGAVKVSNAITAAQVKIIKALQLR